MWRYRLLLLLLSIPLIMLSAWQALRQRDARLLLQRLGLGLPRQATSPAWIHVSSVGEVNAVLPFIRLLKERHPDLALLVTTNTPTGKQVLRKQLPDITHSYLTIDWSWLAAHFIRRVQPCCALVFETEIWPNLFTQLSKHAIPLVIFNGRVSQKSLRAQQRYAGAYRHALSQVDMVLTRSEQDRERYLALGAAATKVKTVGNIKYAGLAQHAVNPITLPRDYILAASTRDGEEAYLVKALHPLLNDTLLVIAPRHPQRRAEIEHELQAAGVHYALRSRDDAIEDNTNVYLADTLGELGGFIGGARFVLMGGAFLPFGGHNILEVAQQGKAVVFGEHMENFADEAHAFIQHGAAIQVSTPQALAEAVQQLLAQPQQAQQLGDNGKALMQVNAAIAERYLEQISHYCPAFQARY